MVPGPFQDDLDGLDGGPGREIELIFVFLVPWHFLNDWVSTFSRKTGPKAKPGVVLLGNLSAENGAFGFVSDLGLKSLQRIRT